MIRGRKLFSDQAGASAIEFVIAVPVLVMFIWGIFQFAILYQANAGLQHALGQGARLATIFPTPSDTQIQTKITSNKFGLGNGTYYTTCPHTCITTDSTAKTKTIKVTYSQPTDFLFFPGPTITLVKEKVVYLAT